MHNSSKEINTFAIKREIERLAVVFSKSSILFENSELEFFDKLEDSDTLFMVLKKEFLRCNEHTMPVVKFLMTKYIEPEVFIPEMEAVIKDSKYRNELKFWAIDVISEVDSNWQEMGYDRYLEYNSEIMQKETQELLESSQNDPSTQIDFLDFLSSISDDDKYILLESMIADQSIKDLVPIFVPLFLTNLDGEIGRYSLKMLAQSKSNYAYESLNQIYEFLNEPIKSAVKKALLELKLSGANKSITPLEEDKKIKDYSLILLL